MTISVQLATGTDAVWNSSGGTSATPWLFTPTSVTNGNARQSAKGDLGANWARLFNVLLTSAVGSAASNGTRLDLYWAPSNSATAGTANPGSVTGVDGTFNTTPSEYVQQLQFVGSLFLSNNAGTGVQSQAFPFQSPTRYGSWVLVNASGQTLSGTAGNHTITATPAVDTLVV